MKTSAISLICVSIFILSGCGARTPPSESQDNAASGVPEAAAYGDPDVPVAGEVLGTIIRTRDVEELRWVILERLTDRYAAEKDLVVTQQEKDLYIAQVAAFMQQERGRASADGNGVPGDAPLDAGAESAEDAAARQEIAEAFIRQWKINRLLFEQYGGRVVYQQGGPEPLDAYRAFLEEQQRAGTFSISDGTLQAEFWRYYVDDARHSFYPPGREGEAFATAPWEADRADAG